MEHEPGTWRRVLVVDDGSILLGAVSAALGNRGYEVVAVALDEEAQTLPTAIDHYAPDVVLVDQKLLARNRRRFGRQFDDSAPKFLALCYGDQPTDSAKLRHRLAQSVTVCTPADIQSLLP